MEIWPLIYTSQKTKRPQVSGRKKWRDEKKKARQKTRIKEITLKGSNAGSNPTNATVKEFMEEFIASYGTKHWGDSYYTGNKAKMKNYVYPYLGQHRIADISTK